MRTGIGGLGICLIWALFLSLSTPALATEPVGAHHDLQLFVDPSQAKVVVEDNIKVRGLPEVSLRLPDWLKLTKVRVDGRAVEPKSWTRDLSISLASNGPHNIHLTAAGTIPRNLGGRRPASQVFAGSDSVYLPGWAGWFPAVTAESVTYNLTITTRAQYRAVATAALKSDQLSKEGNTSTFEAKSSMEPPSVFVGPYKVSEQRFGAVRLRTYFYDDDAKLAQDYLDAAGRYISMFEKEIGPYPFADFHIVAGPLPVGLGFPNLTYVDRRILRLPFMRGRSLAHEVLHNWWGNGVQPDYAKGNWSEGLTTYMADHRLAEEMGPKSAEEMRLGWLRDFAALPDERDMPVTRFVSKRHDAAQVIGYGKTAYIFHMLKQEIGPDQYEAVMRDFWQKHKFQTASWSDIRASVERVTQDDYGWFFEQWTERPGAPQLTIESARVVPEDGHYVLQLSLSQTAPGYRLDVPVHVTTEAGVEKFKVRMAEQAASAEFKLKAKPVKIQIDPSYGLFRRLLPGEAPPIFRDVLLDRGAETVVLYPEQESEELARALAGRLFQRTPLFVDEKKRKKNTRQPLLVLGSASQIDDFIGLMGFPPRPELVGNRGTGRAWTARTPNGLSALFVEADDVDSIRALMRPLPHYRSKSYVVFNGRRAVDRGVWTLTQGPLSKTLE